MLNRRHIRIKILHALYALEQSTASNIRKAENDLFFSIEKMYEMYLYLMLVMVDVRHFARQKIEDNKQKRLPTAEDLNPNMKFADNRLLNQLEENKALNSASDKAKVSWVGESELIRKFYRYMIDTEEYKEYMSSPEDSYEADSEFVIRFFKRHLVNLDAFQGFFDERSIFWADDLDIVASMVIKTFKSFDKEADEFHPILSLWKDPEDEIDFTKVLFRKTITQSEEHMKLIEANTENWEVDRIALMDLILMKMALTEAREFSQIPLKVTLNEYIELSKYYSTPKSNTFINGILDKLFEQMKEEGTIKKIGRGLIT